MKKIIAIVMAASITLSIALIPVSAQLVGTPFTLDATNFIADNQGGTANPSFLEGGIFDVGTMSSIPRLISKENIGKDLDISFNTLLSCSGTDWRMMIMLRDQDAGKASWEGRAKSSAYNVFFGNGSIGIKYGENTEFATPASVDANFFDGQIHAVRISCVTKSDGVNINLYVDDLKTPILTAIDNSESKIDIDGKLTMIFAVNGGVSGSISNLNKLLEDGVPDLTPSLGTVDMLSAGYSTDFLKFGQGANLTANKINLVPISNTVLTNSRFYLDAVQAKDATYNMTMKITNAADAQGWLGMIILRDQMPGYASWERGGAETAPESAGYMIMLNAATVSAVYLTNLATNGTALDNNEWTVPTDFDWSASHVWSIGVAEIAGKTTVTVKVDGTTQITAIDTKAKIVKAGGFSVVLHGDNNKTTAEITTLTIDLADKSSEAPAATPTPVATIEPTVTTAPVVTNPTTGDTLPVIMIGLILIAGFVIIAQKKAAKNN